MFTFVANEAAAIVPAVALFFKIEIVLLDWLATTISGLPSKSWNNAVCDRNGNVYMIDPGTFTLWTFNVNTLAVSSSTLTGISDAASSANFGDLIIDPTTNQLYGFYTAASRGLYRIDTTTNTLILILTLQVQNVNLKIT